MENSSLYLETFQAYLRLYKYCKQEARKRRGQNLNGRQIALLRYLLENGSCTSGELARYLLINKSSTSEILLNLEQKGFIERSRFSGDNRQVKIGLTEAGRNLASEVQVAGIPLLREKLALLNDGELEQFRSLLVKIHTLMGVQDEE